MQERHAVEEDKIDKITDFVHHLYEWSSEAYANAAQIPDIKKEYEQVSNLLDQYHIHIGDVIYNVDKKSVFSEYFDKVFYDEVLSKGKFDTPNAELGSAWFEKMLRDFSESLEFSIARGGEAILLEVTGEKLPKASRRDIRKSVEAEMQNAVKEKNKVSATWNDPLTSEYQTISAQLGLTLLKSILKHPSRDSIMKDEDIKGALNTLAAVSAWEKKGGDGGLKSFYKKYLESEHKFPGDQIFGMTSEDALNKVDEILISKDIGEALKAQIIRDLERISTKGQHIE